jgi:hypothetical protein
VVLQKQQADVTGEAWGSLRTVLAGEPAIMAPSART